MKKFLGILLAIVGLLLSAAGITGVVLIGSDNTVDSPTTTITLGDAKAIVSTPGLLAFKDTTLRLSAQSSGGAAFIGQAHPIDAKSYLSSAPTYAVTKVDTSGMSGVVVKGDPKAALAEPTKQTFWTAKTTGSGVQTLKLRLDGTPTEYVVMPVGKPGDVTVTSGVEVKNGFALSIGAVVLGILALLSGVLLMRRRKTPTSPSGDAITTGATLTAADQESMTPSRTMSRIVTFGVIGAVIPALAGCGMVPTKVDAWKNDAITKPAMANQAEAVAVMKDYDLRNNAAIKATSTTFDPAAWSTADTGPLLTNDVYSTRYRKAKNDKSVNPITTAPGRHLYAPAFANYPMFALLSTTETVRGADKPDEELAVLTRESAASPWLKAASADVPATSLPAAADPGSASTLTPADTKVALNLTQALATQLNSGKGPFTLPKGVNDYLSRERKLQSYQSSAQVRASLWDESSKDKISADGSMQAARTREGQIFMATYSMVATSRTKPNFTMHYKDQAHAVAVGQVGPQEVLNLRSNLTFAVSVDAKGKPTIVGHSFRTIG